MKVTNREDCMKNEIWKKEGHNDLKDNLYI